MPSLRHFDDFGSCELSLQYIDEASTRDDLILDDRDRRKFLRPLDWLCRVGKIFHRVPAFRERPGPLNGLDR
ncbi:MAG: hypothetical protein DME75_12830 [Verrucomicrobia bacterium]|nr:MAG: hypothetical protein DME75_12830 [Verrucomicrobiota bacterium]